MYRRTIRGFVVFGGVAAALIVPGAASAAQDGARAAVVGNTLLVDEESSIGADARRALHEHDPSTPFARIRERSIGRIAVFGFTRAVGLIGSAHDGQSIAPRASTCTPSRVRRLCSRTISSTRPV